MIAGLNTAFPIIDADNDGTIFHNNWSVIEVAVDGKLNVNGTNSMTGPLVLASDPTLALHAATKQYVDSIATGLDIKDSVRLIVTVNITLSGLQTIDSIALNSGDRVLVKGQTNQTENGIYDVSATNWVRSSDADNSPVGEVTSGMFTFIEEGTQSGTGWVLTTADPIVLGISLLTFNQFSNSTVPIPISSVFGRTGAIISNNGDYAASQITNIPGGTLTSTDVQSALNELDSGKASAAQGLLASSAVQPLDNISVLTNDSGYVTSSGIQNVVEDITPQLGGVLDALTNKIINLGTPTLGSDAVTKAYVDAGIGIQNVIEDITPQLGGVLDALTNKIINLGSPTLGSDAATKAYVDAGSGNLVTSVFGRTGAIVPVIGDYLASQIPNTPAGNISSTNVQAALNELDVEKATAAQGALAVSAVQPLDNITVLTNDAGFVTSSGLFNVVEDVTPQLGGVLDAQTNKIINLGTPTLNADATTKAYVDGILTNPVGLIEDFHGFMETPIDKSYVLMLSAAYNFNISQVNLQLSAGTLTAQFRVNNILVGSVLNITSVLLTNSTIINITSGQKVELVISASVAPVDFAFSITRIRT